MKTSAVRLASLFSVISLLAAPGLQAIVDTNNNGFSDLWEQTYNNLDLFPPSFYAQDDPDADGWSNAQEATAGTDPFNPNAPTGFLVPAITHSPAVLFDSDNDGIEEIVTPESHVITWQTLAGKQYTLLFSTNLAAGSWLTIGEPSYGTGSVMGKGIPLTQPDGSTPPGMFWRVKIEDTDSDNDGFNDWEESESGTEPGVADSDNDGLPDDWENAYGLVATDNGSGDPNNGPDGDPDGDGATNIEEYEGDTDPTVSDDYPSEFHSITRKSVQQFGSGDGDFSNYNALTCWGLWTGSPPLNSSVPNAPLAPAAIGPDLAAKIPYPAVTEPLPASAVKAPYANGEFHLENGSHLKYSVTIGEDTSEITRSSLLQGRIWMKISPKQKSSVARKIPYLFVTLRRTQACEVDAQGSPYVVPLENGATIPWTTETSAIVNFEFDANAEISKPLDLDAQLFGADTGTWTICSSRLIPIKVSWKAIDGWDNVGTHVDPWTNKSNGKRIFPCFKDPSSEILRAKVQVVVKTSSALEGTTIHVKAFDVDDSTSETFDVEPDDNNPSTIEPPIVDTNYKSGDDNFADYLGTEKTGEFWDENESQWGGDSASGVVDANGETKFDFRVGMQPGNNYRVVASVIDDSMYSGVQIANSADPKYLGPNQSQNGGAPASPLLTVWRRLWVEQDTMWDIGTHQSEYNSNDIAWDSPTFNLIGTNPIGGLQTATGMRIPPVFNDRENIIDLENGFIMFNDEPHEIIGTLTGSDFDVVVIEGDFTTLPAGTPVRVYDDDGFGLSGSSSQSFLIKLVGVQLQNYFKTAFIEPADIGIFNNDEKVPFKANVGSQLEPVPPEYATPEIGETNNLWVAPVTLAYQGERAEDSDPISEEEGGVTFGVTDNVGEIEQSLVFVETCRDIYEHPIRMSENGVAHMVERLPKFIIATAAHEMGHQPGYEPGVLSGNHHDEGRLMRIGGPSPIDPLSEEFSPTTVERFRRSQKWCK